MTSALQKAAMRVMEAWDETVLPKARDGMTQERMEELRAALAEQAEQEAVAPQHRFRHPEKGTPDWSVWQPCKINNKRPAHEIDSQGYQVEYRALYTAPQPATPPGYKLVPVEPKRDLMWSTVAMQKQHDERIGRIVNTLEQIKQEQLAQPAEQEPVAWEWRWFDTSPYTVTSGQWSEWKRVEPRNSLCTLDDALNEFRAYIANGLRYELRAIYTAPQPRRRLTDEELDNTTRKQVDDLLDHIYEYGTAAEGIDFRVRAIARAIERAHGIGEHE